MTIHSTPSEPSPATHPTASAGSGWFTAAGVAFSVLFVAAWFSHGADMPDTDAPVSEWGDWITKGSTGVFSILSVYLFVLTALSFGAFAHGLAQRVRAAHPDRPSAASRVLALGTSIAVLIAVSGVAVNAAAAQYAMDDAMAPPTDAAPVMMIASIGYGTGLVAAMLAMAAFIAVVTLDLRADAARWFVVLSWICAVVLLAAVIFLPMLAVPVWGIAASIVLRRHAVAG